MIAASLCSAILFNSRAASFAGFCPLFVFLTVSKTSANKSSTPNNSCFTDSVRGKAFIFSIKNALCSGHEDLPSIILFDMIFCKKPKLLIRCEKLLFSWNKTGIAILTFLFISSGFLFPFSPKIISTRLAAIFFNTRISLRKLF